MAFPEHIPFSHLLLPASCRERCLWFWSGSPHVSSANSPVSQFTRYSAHSFCIFWP